MPIERVDPHNPRTGPRQTIVGATAPPQEVMQRVPDTVKERITGPQRVAKSPDFWADDEENGAIYFGGTKIIKLVKGLEPKAEQLAKALNATLRAVVDGTGPAPARGLNPPPPPPNKKARKGGV